MLCEVLDFQDKGGREGMTFVCFILWAFELFKNIKKKSALYHNALLPEKVQMKSACIYIVVVCMTQVILLCKVTHCVPF